MDTLSLGAPRAAEQTLAFRSNGGLGTAATLAVWGDFLWDIREERAGKALREERGVRFAAVCGGALKGAQGSGFALGAEEEIKR